jgi:hypothetical protein
LVAGCLDSLGRMKSTRSRLFAIAVIAIAAALHAYEQPAKSSAPGFGWFLWSMVPYGVCLLVLLRAKSGIPGALGVSTAFALDLVAHYDVFVHPKGSTAALALLFVPLWSALIIAPVVMFAAWLAVRRRGLKSCGLTTPSTGPVGHVTSSSARRRRRSG